MRSCERDLLVFCRTEPLVFTRRNDDVSHFVSDHVPDAVGKDMCAAPEVLLRFALQLFFEELSAFSARVRECHGKFPHGGKHACPWTLVQEYFAVPDADGAGGA